MLLSCLCISNRKKYLQFIAFENVRTKQSQAMQPMYLVLNQWISSQDLRLLKDNFNNVNRNKILIYEFNGSHYWTGKVAVFFEKSSNPTILNQLACSKEWTWLVARLSLIDDKYDKTYGNWEILSSICIMLIRLK